MKLVLQPTSEEVLIKSPLPQSLRRMHTDLQRNMQQISFACPSFCLVSHFGASSKSPLVKKVYELMRQEKSPGTVILMLRDVPGQY